MADAARRARGVSSRVKDARQLGVVPKGLGASLKRARYADSQGGDHFAFSETELIVLYENAIREMMAQGRIIRRLMFEAFRNIEDELEEELLAESLSYTKNVRVPWHEHTGSG